MAVYKTLQEIVDTWSGCLFGILPISEKTKILCDDDNEYQHSKCPCLPHTQNQPQHLLKVPMFYRFSKEQMKCRMMHFLHDDEDGLWPEGPK